MKVIGLLSIIMSSKVVTLIFADKEVADMTDYQTKLIQIINDDPSILAILEAVEQLNLPDAWVSAGLIRNKVWDVLHGIHTPINDIDVVYYDPLDTTWETEEKLERQLEAILPNQPWSVKNQARMHVKNGLAPFQSSYDGVAHFPETPTAIAVRLHRHELEVMAPHGLGDLFNKIVKPTPYYQKGSPNYPIYRKRIQDKQWDLIWKDLTIEE